MHPDRRLQSVADFEQAHRRATLLGVLARLVGRPAHLLSFADARRSLGATDAQYLGVREVPIEAIVGSTERARDFDRAFRPRRAKSAGRWQRIAHAHYDGIELPAVQLYELDGRYFVIDGHHRVSVARTLGRSFIDAEVTAIRVRSRHSQPAPIGLADHRRTARQATPITGAAAIVPVAGELDQAA